MSRLVLRVITRLNTGGPARHVIRIARPLAERGWRCVLAAGHVAPGETDLVDEARDAGLDVRVIPELGRAPRPGDDLRALSGLARLTRRLRPDVVHTHTAKAGALGRLAALTARPRPALVHTYHGHVLSGYFGPVASRLCGWTEAALARVTDRLVAVSESVRDELVDDHGVGRRRQYAVVPPGIDLERTRVDRPAGRALRARLGVAADDVLVGVVGRLAPIKGVDRALEAYGRVARQDPRARLLVVGEGPERAATERRLASLPGARLLSSRPRLGDVWGALDLTLLASHREGLPQALVESLRAGVPAVATAVGGVPELVRHGVDGLLAPPDDAAALTAALERLVTDDGLRHRASRNARQRGWERHHAASVARDLAEVYDTVCGRELETQAASGHAAAACTLSY